MENSKNSPIAEVISQTSNAAEQVKSASNELEVVHAVLSTEVAPEQAHSDVVAAVERTEEIAQQLAVTAEALEKSNEMLREIKASPDRAAA